MPSKFDISTAKKRKPKKGKMPIGGAVRKVRTKQAQVLGPHAVMNDNETIGARVGRSGAQNRAFARMTPRQKARLAIATRALPRVRFRPFPNLAQIQTTKRDRFKRKLWDEKTRPSFTKQTLENMLKRARSRQRRDGVTVYECEDGKYYPLKRDRVDDEAFVTLDHKTDWQTWIWRKATPLDDGHITKESATAAYNDMSNLVLMSSTRNAQKNGPRGVFD